MPFPLLLPMLGGCWVFWNPEPIDEVWWADTWWRDSGIVWDSDSVLTIDDPEQAPILEITTPLDESLFTEGQDISIRGAYDLSGSTPILTEWRINGLVVASQDATIEWVATAGEHLVELWGWNENGDAGTDSITLYVRPPGHSTSCKITAPIDGATTVEGLPIAVYGEATLDEYAWLTSAEVATATASVTATVDSEGKTYVFLPPHPVGTHTITLTMNDRWSARCTYSVDHEVVPEI